MRGAAALLAAWVGLAPGLLAQETPSAAEAPFSRIRVRASLGAGGLDGTTGAYWDAGREWSAEAAGSFHGGWLAVQADRTPFRGREPGLPAVTGTHLWVGWLRALALPLDLEAEAGAFVGGLWMEDEEGRMGEPEAEMAVAAQLALTGPRLGPLRPFARTRLRRVFFERPLDVASASAGLEWSVGLPTGLSGALGGEGAAPGGSDRARPPEPTAHRTAAHRTTLTRADLDRAGVTRWEDLYRLLPGWRTASVDRFAWRLAPPGGGLFDDAHPKVLVDGIPVPVSVLGVAGLEHLPVSPADVDSVRVLEGPLLEAGEPVLGGLLHLHTRRPRSLEAGASHQEGNPAGDAGLLGLTPLDPGNVDRIGRYTTYRAAAGGEAAGAWVGRANLTRYHPGGRERPRIERAWAPVDGKPYIHTRRTAAGGGLDGEAGSVRMLAGATRTDDFFLLPAVGTEVLTRNDHGFAGAAGRLALGGAGALRLRAALSGRTLRRHDFDPRPGFDFRQRSVSATAEWSGGGPAGVGLHYDLRRADAPPDLDGEDVHRARLFGRLELPAEVRLDASLTRVGDGWGGALAAVRSWRWEAGGHLAARAAVASVPFAGSDGFAAWWLRGYRPPIRPDLRLEVEGGEVPEEAGSRRSLMVDLRGGRRLAGGAVSVEGGLWLRRTTGAALLAPRFRVVEGIPEPVRGDAVPFRTGERGSRAGAWIRGRGRLVDGWSWGAAAYRDAVLAGTEGFRRARREVPAGRASAWLLWHGLPDLTVRASVRRRGPTRWAGYEAAGSEARARVAGRTTVDVAVQKWLWEGRLRGLIRVGDLLDQDRPLHPLGVTPGLHMQVRGEVRLGR